MNDPKVFRRDCFILNCATTLFNQRDSARLTHCMTKGEMIHVGELRRIIRGAEMELRTIERMVDALKQRFPEVGDRRRA